MLFYMGCDFFGKIFYYIGIKDGGLLFKHIINLHTGLTEDEFFQIIKKYKFKSFNVEEYIEYYGFENEQDVQNAIDELNFFIKIVS